MSFHKHLVTELQKICIINKKGVEGKTAVGVGKGLKRTRRTTEMATVANEKGSDEQTLITPS